jgi:hypothetical protein
MLLEAAHLIDYFNLLFNKKTAAHIVETAVIWFAISYIAKGNANCKSVRRNDDK